MHQQTFLARFPWLAISIAMIPSVFVFGPNILRFITILAVAHIALYLPYGDLHPRNLYIYGTVHYFKLWLPYFALIGVAGFVFLLQRRTSPRAICVAAIGIALRFFCVALGFICKVSRFPPL